MNYTLTQKNLLDCIQRRVEWEHKISKQVSRRVTMHSNFARKMMSLLKLEVVENVR